MQIKEYNKLDFNTSHHSQNYFIGFYIIFKINSSITHF